MGKTNREPPRLNKTVYTTGEVAEICQLSQQTVIRCFDSGRLRGFRVPGSRFRRIPRESLIQFMKEHDIPLDQIDSGKTRVLVVDDDPAIVELLVDMLERDGRFEVATASTGFDAGMRVREFLPDVMILDYMLPDINGNLVCKRIRSDDSLGHVKIVIVSGVIEREHVEQLLHDGADDFIQKPFKIDELINRLLELARA
ncbi:DNA-binding response regulator MtrA [Phycisphaerae bacterium RAS1]|nr:DNA-binding response regulator MtrA [Phycisphaerae bacterium RAS1]